MTRHANSDSSRLLVSVGVVTVLALLGSCTLAPSTPPAAPQPGSETVVEDRDRVPESPQQGLEWLLEGNRRFAEARPHHDHESQRRRMMLAGGQNPFGVVLGCSDSRVPPELIFDSGLGDLFVIRVAGNVVASDEAGSIEYAIDHLGVRLVVVLGHEGCGAVTAALGSAEGEAEELGLLLAEVRPALNDIDPSLPKSTQIEFGVDANVRRSVQKLRVISDREALPPEDRALIVGAVYDLDTGLVRVLED